MENTEISKTVDIGKFPGRLLKDDTEILSKPISEVCNPSMSYGIFPNFCKVANSNLFDPCTYRSISVLSLISRILEKLVHNQTNEFLSDNKILCNYQSRFKPNHSINLCLSFLTDNNSKRFWWRIAKWNDFNWSTESFWHKSRNLVKETWSYRFFGPMYAVVLVISSVPT